MPLPYVPPQSLPQSPRALGWLLQDAAIIALFAAAIYIANRKGGR